MLDLRFLNVGHGDCTLVEFPSKRLAMIDINNSKSFPESDVDALAESAGLGVQAFRTLAVREGQSWEDYYSSLLVDPADGSFETLESDKNLDFPSLG